MKKIFTFFVVFFIYISPTYAACDFIIDIGDKKTKFVERFTEPFPQFEGLFMLPVPSPEICPNDNLDQDIAVEYIFLGENLASIRMLVFKGNAFVFKSIASEILKPQVYNNRKMA